MVLTLPPEEEFLEELKKAHRMTDAEHEEFNNFYGVDPVHPLPTPPEERFQDHAGHNGH